jgi:hypothetical protein
MKLTNVATILKSKAVRVLAAATLAGAVLTAAAPAAQAQRFVVGVRVGGPRYVAPAPVYYGYAPGYFDHRRFDEHEAWIRHEQFDRFHDRRFDNRDHRR